MSFAALESSAESKPSYRIGILGGVGEFGRNCTIIEDASGKMIVIDAGMMFPGPGLPGVNRVIPDFGNLIGRESDILALVITHGHEDHIGAIPQFLAHVPQCDIYASALAIGIYERKVQHLPKSSFRSIPVSASQTIDIGPFRLTFVAANHSIPQTLGVLVEVQGSILYFTGDFRLDDSPLVGHVTDHREVSRLVDGRRIDFMLIDSTNAGQDGSTRRETSVLTSIRPAFAAAPGRVYFTTFASHIERQMLAIALAQEFNRKVFVAGAAMTRNVKLASSLGLHNFPRDLLVDREEALRLRPDQLLVLASGSQGEPGSFLDRLAQGSQSHFSLRDDDLIIFSSVPIPGNEPKITRNIDKYMRAGAKVLHYRDAHVHVSGHARNDEIGALVHTIRPVRVMPIHGDFYNIVRCAELVERVGGSEALVVTTGDVIEVFGSGDVGVRSSALSDRPVYVDDHSDDIDDETILERKILSEQGLILVHLSVPAEGTSRYSIVDIRYFGFSGAPIDNLVERALTEFAQGSRHTGVVKLVRNTIYRTIGGPRGNQAKVAVIVSE